MTVMEPSHHRQDSIVGRGTAPSRFRAFARGAPYNPGILEREANPATSESPRRILVIDDARVVRSLLRHWLERLGYRVVEAQNGPQGLAAVDSGSIDLVICEARRGHAPWSCPRLLSLPDQADPLRQARGDAQAAPRVGPPGASKAGLEG
jgi:hypothetical protein